MKISINNLNKVSAQKVFNFIGKHLLTQMEQSGDEYTCFYRFEKNDGKILTCAAGCLIPNNNYEKKMEGKHWSAVVRDWGLSKAHEDLIWKLQSIHDNKEPTDWRKELRNVAEENKLSFRYLEKL
jgi:hypothetical protein